MDPFHRPGEDHVLPGRSSPPEGEDTVHHQDRVNYRPGEMVRCVDGLTTKVLNQCLRKNIEFNILARVSYNEVPPRVEYEVTEFGRKFMRVLDELDTLQNEIDGHE